MIPAPSEPASESLEIASTRHVDLYIAFIVAMTIGVIALLSTVQFHMTMRPVNGALFAIFSVLLFASETLTSSLWLRFSRGGVVTLSWTFAFSLLLLGNPTMAVAVMALSTLTAEVVGRTGLRKTLFNTAQVSFALAAGGLVLIAFGVDGPITRNGAIPTSWGVGVLASGVSVFLLNGVVLGYLLSVVERTSFVRMMRDGFARSMMVDGTLLALAPIIVITTGYSLVVAPLLAIAGSMVYQTARESMRREHLANHDTLTTLRNRRSFGEEVERFLQDRIEVETTGLLLLLDLDGFKAVNDSLGHHVGDELLCAFGNRLIESLPSSAVIARLGGDEFAVLLRDVDVAQTLPSIRRLHAQLTAPLAMAERPIPVGVSIGVAICPDHGTESTDLLRSADTAMYRAKERRTGVEVFDERIARPRSHDNSSCSELEVALARGRLTLVLQPRIRVFDRSIDSVEASFSWERADFVGSAMRSDEVRALAERNELLGPLTDSLIETAVRNVSTIENEQLSLSVRIEPVSLLDDEFASRTLGVLGRLEFMPSRLELAIDERSLADESDHVSMQIHQLRRAGVRIALEGFGAGHASLLKIREPLVDRIKIGTPFVEQLCEPGTDRVIARAMVDLAHALGREVVAVGVEDQGTWEALAELGFDFGQGSHVGDEMGIRDLTRWLVERRAVERIEVAR